MLGYSSFNIIDNIGDFRYYYIIIAGVSIILSLIKPWAFKYPMILKIYTYLAEKLFFNLILTLILLGYTETIIGASLNLSYVIN